MHIGKGTQGEEGTAPSY